MRNNITFVAILFIIITLTFSARAENLLNQCWKQDELKKKHREKRPVFGTKRAYVKPASLDIPALKAIPKEYRGSIRSVSLPKGKKLIALTLDLCELPREVAGYDGAIIDYLRKHNVKATLFSGGKWLLTHKERAAQLLADPLFEIGSHAWTHGNFRRLSLQKSHREIQYTQAAFQQTKRELVTRQCAVNSKFKTDIQQNIKLFRFPYGSCRPETLKKVADSGLLAIQWNISTGDPSKAQSAKRIARHVLRSVKPGSIIIAHANGRGWHTAKALPLFIPRLKKLGYEFVTVSELLAAGKPVISSSCYSERVGDTNHYGWRKAMKKLHKKARKPRRKFRLITSETAFDD